MIYFSASISIMHKTAINTTLSIDAITDEINNSLIEMTGTLAVARSNEKKKMLRSNQETLALIDAMERCRNTLNKNFQCLISYCSNAFNRIDQKLDTITEQIGDLNEQAFNNVADSITNEPPDLTPLMNQIKQQFELLKTEAPPQSVTAEQLNKCFQELKESTNETNDYTCSNIDALSAHVESLNKNITLLYDLIKPPQLNRDYIEAAKYIIDNVKNNQGKTINSGNITIANVAAILEAYDRMTKHGK